LDRIVMCVNIGIQNLDVNYLRYQLLLS